MDENTGSKGQLSTSPFENFVRSKKNQIVNSPFEKDSLFCLSSPQPLPIENLFLKKRVHY